MRKWGVNVDPKNEIYTFLLMRAIGYENRVKAGVLMSITGIKDHKALRKLIEELRLDKNKAIIGSEAGSNGGYYICETEEEKQKTINHFKHRAGQMYKIAHILEGKKV